MFPSDLEQAESLRDAKRKRLAALFEESMVLKKQMESLEEELMGLDDHIDNLLYQAEDDGEDEEEVDAYDAERRRKPRH